MRNDICFLYTIWISSQLSSTSFQTDSFYFLNLQSASKKMLNFVLFSDVFDVSKLLFARNKLLNNFSELLKII